ncbi:MAG: hybrid sensor histidine kinase/response regulator, partial [Pedobacter sp.]
MRLRIYFICIWVLFIPTSLFSQNDNTVQFSHLDITNGLSDNQVNCIFKDKKGFMWFGTTSGLNRYDGSKFKIFKREPKDPQSIVDNHVMSIAEGPGDKLWVFTHSGISIYDPTMERFSNNVNDELRRYGIASDGITKLKKDIQGDFWFATSKEGLFRYHTKSGKTTSYSNLRNLKNSEHSNQILDILGSEGDLLWLIYGDGFIIQLDTRTNKVLTRYDGIAKAIYTKPRNFTMLMDKRKNLWICSDAGPIGVFCYKTQSKELLHYNRDTQGARLNSNVITSIVQTDDDKIWVGSDHGGINIIDPVANRITYILNKPDDAKSLSGNSVYIYRDNSGIIWAGTFKQGINYYHKNIMQFPLYRQLSNSAGKVVLEDVNSFEEDEKNNLWIGTNGGGLIYFDRAANSYRQFKHDPTNANSLSSDIVVRLYLDKRKRLWIGTYFGGLDCFDGKTFTHYRHNKLDPSSLSDDRVYAITEDVNNELWVGTFAGGLNILDPKTNTFRHPDISGVSDYTSVIYEDRQHNKWIGRDKGVDLLLKGNNKARHYTSIANNPNSLVGNDVNIIIEDKKGLIWIGTKDGLSILNPRTNKFINLEEGMSLPA